MSTASLFCLFGLATATPGQEGLVSYPAGKDKLQGYLCRPEGTGPFPAVIIVHGDYGFGDHEKQLARRLAKNGFVALAVDLYRGVKVVELIDAHIMDRGLPESQALGDLDAAVTYLTGRADVRRGDIGIIGWDMGGGYALDAARRDRRLRAAVTCYGRLTTDPALLAPMQASVLGLFAGKDIGITPATIEQFRKAMLTAGKRAADLHIYPECEHGFLNPRPPAGRKAPPETVADAWSRIDAYFARELNR
jgi:carboxymethylenebutenolidase